MAGEVGEPFEGRDQPQDLDPVRLPDSLWDHQRAAVQTVGAYLASTTRGDRSALITMPTGTGKTGVIACCVTLLAGLTGNRLVLTPWDALVRQLEVDLRERFWSRLPDRDRPAVPRVRRLPSSSDFAEIGNTDQPTIFVSTIAAVSVLARRSQELGYDIGRLFSGFDLVVVDEGHYEPAPDWSRAIRSLGRPTVLLTATPYRNDEKYFQIGDEGRYRFSHQDAERRHFLRTPIFETMGASGVEQFARRVVDFMRDRVAAYPDARAIIRCGDSNRIRAMVQALQAAGQSVVGVHERFSGQEAGLLRQVPSTAYDARYWVHQNKLIEGIDDPRFRVLASYDSLRNDRAVIQQIGRILRNPAQSLDDSTAFVIGRGDRDLGRVWTSYRNFDAQEEADSVATMPELITRVLSAQPESVYYDGAYRTRIDLDDARAWKDFAYPLRTRIYRSSQPDPPTLERIAAATTEEWADLDRKVYATQSPDPATVIIPYVTGKNSPLLRSATFIETEFGYTLLQASDGLLFVYDAQGRTPAIVQKGFRLLVPAELESLFPAGTSSLTSVSLLNTDIGRHAARSRHLRAAAIQDLAPDLADYGYVCSIAEGYTEAQGVRFRRYVGMSRSRVADYLSTERDYTAHNDWLRGLDGQLTARAIPTSTLGRYAKVVGEPGEKSPVHVLLDIDAAAFVRTTGTTQEQLDLDDTAVPVVGGRFQIVANGVSHPATISWDSLARRYDVQSPSLAMRGYSLEGDDRELLSYLTEEQALRVVPESAGAIYAHGYFFKPIIPTRNTRDFRLLDILEPVVELGAAASEKGTAIVGDDWDPVSVFGLITSLDPASGRPAPAAFASQLAPPDMLLCTDLGTEIADFVAVKGRRVVFLHAKASSDRRLCSASALHDAASQAIKNLHYLHPVAEERPPMNYWTNRWGFERGPKTRRLRVGAQTTSARMWSTIREVISDPNGEREVWLVLGQCLSKQALIDQSNRTNPSPEALQVYSLLQTTWGAVSQLGARLRILCSP